MTINNNAGHTDDDFDDWYDPHYEIDLSIGDYDDGSVDSSVNATD